MLVEERKPHCFGKFSSLVGPGLKGQSASVKFKINRLGSGYIPVHGYRKNIMCIVSALKCPKMLDLCHTIFCGVVYSHDPKYFQQSLDAYKSLIIQSNGALLLRYIPMKRIVNAKMVWI